MKLPLIIGHRGASAVAPENTIAAFERALGDGADGIEFDVRLARRTVDAARAAGLQTVVWTVDHPSWVRRACALGLRAVITNDPARIRAACVEFLKQ